MIKNMVVEKIIYILYMVKFNIKIINKMNLERDIIWLN